MVYQLLYIWSGVAWQVTTAGWVDSTQVVSASFLDALASNAPPTYAALYIWDGTRWNVSRNY